MLGGSVNVAILVSILGTVGSLSGILTIAFSHRREERRADVEAESAHMMHMRDANQGMHALIGELREEHAHDQLEIARLLSRVGELESQVQLLQDPPRPASEGSAP